MQLYGRSEGGRRALFESFGLGKTVQALEWCNIITRKEGGQAFDCLTSWGKTRI